MNLTVTRRWFTPLSTCGMLDIDGVFQAYTMEPRLDQVGTGQPKAKPCAIPRGTYQVELTWSPKFQCLTPHVEDVPEFEYIEIHWGNKPSDTEGCLIVGKAHKENWLDDSRVAFVELMVRLNVAQNRITITYTGLPQEFKVTALEAGL